MAQPADDNRSPPAKRAEPERWEFLENLDALTERPLLGLSFVWLVLLVLDLTTGLNPVLRAVNYSIWALFVLDALVEIVIAPDRLGYVKRRWYVLISLAIPAFRPLAALRSLRLLRTVRAVRALSLARVLSGLNRGIRSLRNFGETKGVGYVVSLSLIVLFGGAAGMYWLEGAGVGADRDSSFDSYADAVWWTAMMLTTVGADFFPETLEGRVLAWLLAVYAFAVFGYVTAAIASFLVGKDKSAQQAREDNDRLQRQIGELNERLAQLQASPNSQDDPAR